MSSNARVLLKGKHVRSRDEVADFLLDLATQVRGLEIELSLGDQDVSVQAGERMGLALEVKDTPKADHVKRELEVELWWHLDEPAPSQG